MTVRRSGGLRRRRRLVLLSSNERGGGIRVKLLALAAAVAAVSVSAAAAPLEVYGKLPLIEQVALSPDGGKLAFAVTDGENRTVLVKDMKTGAVVGGLRAGEHKVRAIQWAGSGHLIVTTSVTSFVAGSDDATRHEWLLAEDYNLATKKQTGLLEDVRSTVGPDHDTANVLYGLPQIRTIGGHPFAFVEGAVIVGDESHRGLFKIDIDRNDATTVIETGFTYTNGYLVDAQGNPLVESEYDAQGPGHWTLRLKKESWRTVDRDFGKIEHPELESLTQDGRAVIVRVDSDKGSMFRELSIGDGSWTEPRAAPDDLISDPVTGLPIGEVSLEGDVRTYKLYNPADQTAWDAIRATYPNSLLSLSSISADHRKMVVRVDALDSGPGYALVDLDQGKSDWLGAEYPDVKPADINPQKTIKFKAADGLQLSGYVTLPAGKPAKGLPLVVFPNGGPAVRDEPGFDWWAQAMASRGYAVLQVNYRGSSGFDWDFMAKGFGEWGRKMQTDLSDGVRALAGTGMIDPKRVCIVGASYGGYAALAGATLDTGVYRCAVSVAGPSDLKRMVADDKNDDGDQGVGVERYWYRYMGPKDQVGAISPANLADKVTIPILLIQGKDDTVVPFVQSQIMADRLKAAGKPYEFVVLAKEDHWLLRGEQRLQMLQATMAFLAKNNPAD